MGQCLMSNRHSDNNSELNLTQVNILLPASYNSGRNYESVLIFTNGEVERDDAGKVKIDYAGNIANITISDKAYNSNDPTTTKRFTLNTEYNKNVSIIMDVSKYKRWTFIWYASSFESGTIRDKTVSLTSNISTTIDFTTNFGYIFGVEIDLTNPDPDLACKYTDNAEGFSPLYIDNSEDEVEYGSWNIDFINEKLGIKPCYLYRNGNKPVKEEKDGKQVTKVKYLSSSNTSDFADRSNGSNPLDHSSIIMYGASTLVDTNIDVMVEFQPRWYKFSINNNILSFKVASYQVDDTWKQNAFLTTDGRKDDSNRRVVSPMYYGMYEACIEGGGLSVRSHIHGSYNNDIYSNHYMLYNNFNTSDGYVLADWNRRCYITGLLWLVTKNRCPQTVLSNGNNGNTTKAPIGELKEKGLFGRSKETGAIKVFGIENFWGNYPEYVDGIVSYHNNNTDYIGIRNYNKNFSIDLASGLPINIDSDYTKCNTKTPITSDKLYLYSVYITTGGNMLPGPVQADQTLSFADAISSDISYNAGFIVVGTYPGYDDNDIGPMALHMGQKMDHTSTNDNKIVYRLMYCN